MRLIRMAGRWNAVARVRGAMAAMLSALALLAAGGPFAWAEEPLPWEMGMQPAATPVRERMDAFHTELLVIITLITVFVMALLIFVMWRFNARRHPVPSQTT